MVICGLSAVPHARAQEKEGDTVRLTLSPSSGLPDSEVILPIYLWSGGASVGSLTVDITFPGRLVSFVKVERTFLSEMTGTQVQSEVAADSTEDASVLKLVLATPAGTPAREAIPDGPIAYLTFRVGKDTPLNTEVVLGLKAAGASADDPSRPLPPVAAPEGKITVQAAPVSGCFFYMH